MALPQSAWLHEEVGRRMEDRLQWIVAQPKRWAHWHPLRGGTQAHGLVSKRYPHAECLVLEDEALLEIAKERLQPAWWRTARWLGPKLSFESDSDPVDMVWANMALHMDADPQALIARWHRSLAVDGFLMFSCLGPDTLRELRALYAAQGWPAPCHAFTDMHDWGDMLVRAGFAEPVMDMERITLSFSAGHSVLAELRGLGRNLNLARFPSLRGRAWRDRLCATMEEGLSRPGESGRLVLTFEVIYGHAFKPKPKAALGVKPQTTFSLEEMRETLARGRK
jgi:malonyl-CoA O-methyltransferase